MSTRKAKIDAFARMTEALKAPVAAQDNAPGGTRGAKPAAATKKVATRVDTKLVAAHVPEATHRALRHVMAEDGTTMQQLLEEAIADLLVKKGAARPFKA